MKRTILIGGGYSIKEGIEKGLWDKIKDEEIWSLNSAFKTMPYLPKRELFVDASFFKHEASNLQKLHEQGVKLISRKHNRLAPFQDEITQYNTSRDLKNYFGKEAIKNNIMFHGRMGIVGLFSLSVAVAEGYTEIFLLGYDFGSPNINEINTHYYQNKITELDIHSSGAGRPIVYMLKDGKIKREIEDFKVYTQETEIKIWNVSLISNIPYFEKISFEELFKKLK